MSRSNLTEENSPFQERYQVDLNDEEPSEMAGLMTWINCKEQMPADMEVVIALYLGHWPGRGNSGITDAYAVDGRWINIPEGITIAGWMPVPDKGELPEWLATSIDDHVLVDLCKERMNEKSVHVNLDDDESSIL